MTTAIAYSVEDAVALTGLGRTRLYDAIASGKLTAKKFGRRTIITADALEAFIESLPLVKPSRPHNGR